MRLAKSISAVTASAALLLGATPASANWCQPGSPCVLPLPLPSVPPVVTTTTTPPPVYTEPVVEGGGGSILPYVLGILALAGIGYVLLQEDEEPGVSA
jgi:hypothetical protein